MLLLDHPLGALIDIVVVVAIWSAAVWVKDEFFPPRIKREKPPPVWPPPKD